MTHLRSVEASEEPEHWMAPVARAALEVLLKKRPVSLVIMYEEADMQPCVISFPASPAMLRGMLEYALDDQLFGGE